MTTNVLILKFPSNISVSVHFNARKHTEKGSTWIVRHLAYVIFGGGGRRFSGQIDQL